MEKKNNKKKASRNFVNKHIFPMHKLGAVICVNIENVGMAEFSISRYDIDRKKCLL